MAQKNKLDPQSWMYFQDLFLEKVSTESTARERLTSEWTSVSGDIDGLLLEKAEKIAEKKNGLSYQSSLMEASMKLPDLNSEEELVRFMTKLISKHIDFSHNAYFLIAQDNEFYDAVYSEGISGKRIPAQFVHLRKDCAFIRIMTQTFGDDLIQNKIIHRQKLSAYIENHPVKNHIEKMQWTLLKDALSELDALGAEICFPISMRNKIKGLLFFGPKTNHQKYHADEIDFLSALNNQTAFALEHMRIQSRLVRSINYDKDFKRARNNLYMHFALALTSVIEAKDPETYQHVQRVSQYALIISGELEGDKEVEDFDNFEQTLWIAALLHDIGKIGISDDILLKPDRFSIEEYKQMQAQPIIGSSILKPFQDFDTIRQAVASHKEKFDGTGYPKKLKGKSIPLCARIIALADAIDALTVRKIYKKQKTPVNILSEIKRESGRHFDPKVVKAFFQAYRKGKILSDMIKPNV